MTWDDNTCFKSNGDVYICWGLNSHCFPMVGMGINIIVGLYVPIIRIPY